MSNYHYSKNWRAFMLALPLLLSSLTGLASNYNIDFGYPEADRNVLKDVTGADLWTYSTEGVVSNLSYSENLGGLCFYLEKSDNGNGSLSLTTVKNFSGKFQGMNLFCDNVDRLVVKLYAGQRELGEMEFNGKVYEISGLDNVLLMNEPITLKFTIAENTIDFGQNQQISNWEINNNGKNNNLVLTNGGVQVSGLSSVEIAVDDSVVPLEMDKAVAFDPSELSSADLSNYSYSGILFTLNESNGDGFENEEGEGVIYIGSLLTDAAVNELNNAVKNHNYSPGDFSYALNFAGGITMMVSKGKGFIKIEAENESDFAFHVKVGDNAPVQISSTTRKWLSVPYDVNEDTYVYIYMVEKTSAVRAGTRIGRRATAHGKIYYAKCTGSVDLPGDVNGNGIVDLNDVNAIVDYIMGTPPVGFNLTLADVNGDGTVNVADLVKVIQIVKEHTIAE